MAQKMLTILQWFKHFSFFFIHIPITSKYIGSLSYITYEYFKSEHLCQVCC